MSVFKYISPGMESLDGIRFWAPGWWRLMMLGRPVLGNIRDNTADFVATTNVKGQIL